MLQARAVGRLPFAIQDAAAAVTGPQVVTLLGGLDSSDTSRDAIQRLSSGSATSLGTLQTPLHDAAAVPLGSSVYLFGGGQSQSVSSIVRLDPGTGHTQPAGSLPQPNSDLGAAAVGGTAYLVGGYNSSAPLDTILAWRPGTVPTVVGRLPQPLRYAAVAAVSGKILIAGGDTPNGPSAQVLEFDPATREVSPLATLPRPVSHAAAAALGGYAYVIGGRTSSGAPTRDITAIDPRTGAASPAGQLPRALSDATVAGLADTIMLVGGRGTGGTVDNILELTRGSGRGGGARSATKATGLLRPGSDPSVLPGPVLIADKLNNRLLEVTPQGNIIWRFPRSGDLQPGQSFLVPDDAFYTYGGRDIVATQEDDFVISVIDTSTHRITYRYGHPGVPGSSPGYVFNPDDAIQLHNGNIISADIKNCRLIQVRQAANNLAAQVGETGGCLHDPPAAFGSPNGAFPLSDGGIVVTEINGDWVDVFDRNGKLVSTANPPGFGYPSDTNEVRPGVYLSVDYEQPGTIMEFDAHGNVLWRYSPSGPDELNHPSLALPLPNGDVLANDDYNNRVIVVDPRTKRIVWQYGHTGVVATAPGYLNNPDGVDLAWPYSLIDHFSAVRGLPGH